MTVLCVTKPIDMSFQDLEKELFHSEVIFSEGKGINYARWANFNHPDNSKLSQKVYWLACENEDKSKVRLMYCLDKESLDMVDYCFVPYDGSFEDVVYSVWIK